MKKIYKIPLNKCILLIILFSTQYSFVNAQLGGFEFSDGYVIFSEDGVAAPNPGGSSASFRNAVEFYNAGRFGTNYPLNTYMPEGANTQSALSGWTSPSLGAHSGEQGYVGKHKFTSVGAFDRFGDDQGHMLGNGSTGNVNHFILYEYTFDGPEFSIPSGTMSTTEDGDLVFEIYFCPSSNANGSSGDSPYHTMSFLDNSGNVMLELGTGNVWTSGQSGTGSSSVSLWSRSAGQGSITSHSATGNGFFANSHGWSKWTITFHMTSSGTDQVSVKILPAGEDAGAGITQSFFPEITLLDHVNLIGNINAGYLAKWQLGYEGGGNKYFFDDQSGSFSPLMPPCAITNLSVSNRSSCNNNGTAGNTGDDWFTGDVTVTFNDPPATGNLVLSGDVLAGGGVLSVPVATAGAGPTYTFTGVRLVADGSPVSVTATFDADPTCTFTNSTIPSESSCSGAACNLSITSVTANCQAGDNGKYDVTVNLSYQNSAGGAVIVTLGTGQTEVSASTTVATNGTTTATFFGLTNTGGTNITVNAAFISTPACAATQTTYSAPIECCPEATQKCPGDTYTLTAEPGWINYQWFFDADGAGPGAAVMVANTQVYTPVSAVGTYTWTAEDPGGCPVTGCCPIVIEESTMCAIDRGDLPDTGAGTGTNNYETLIASDGACHNIVPGLKMGATVDIDFEGAPEAMAGEMTGGDDNDTDAPNAGDDEDGIAAFPMFIAGQTATVTVSVMNMITPATDAYLYGFIDWNSDGDFDDFGEMVDVVVPSGTTSSDLVFNVPANAVLNTKVGARFRISTDDTLDANSANGCAVDGEVEDYMITVMGFDYGDLPDSGAGTGPGNYSTTSSDNGPSHKIDPLIKLGAVIDADSDGQPSVNADGDNSTVAPGTNDEDGVTLPMFVTGVPADITVSLMNMTGGAAKLVLYADWNGDGDFDDTNEMYSEMVADMATSAMIQVTPPLTSLLNVPIGIRVRLSTDLMAVMSPTGPALNGEVEDYVAPVMGYDYGDLPDSGAGTGSGVTVANYLTQNSDSGARHKITTDVNGVPVLKMGMAVDDEADGQQNATANGDDNTGTPATDPDDEDGIASFPLFIPGQPATITVSVMNSGSAATLYGFIDWDKDGEFFSPNENVTVPVPANTTGNVDITFNVPLTAVQGMDLGARFRLTTAFLVGPSGTSPDGEVEDYLVRVADLDLGDLPDTGAGTGTGNYETQMANNGPVHVIVDGIKIGASEDKEADGQQSAGANGDDNTGPAPDDEDGYDPLVPGNMLVAGRTSNLVIPVMNTIADGKIVVFVDFNNNGSFTDPGEMASQNVPLNASSATVSMAVPTDAVINVDLGMRIRLSSDPDFIANMFSTGVATDGEVEDYLVQVMGFDYGDLADSGPGAGVGNYETQDANGGPSHKITPTLKLGASVDAEGNGQQSTNADGDDSTTAPGTDDEDGVTLPMFVTGVPSDITVSLMNMTGVDAKLTVFIDFNNNGVFEASEMFSSTVANNATSATIPVTPPLTSWLNAPVGVRVRLSTDMTASMSPTGPAPDGEVEDYTTVIMGFDYGDLNDPSAGTGTAPFGTAANYSTLATDNGAAHKLTTNPLTNEVILKIGTAEDDEATGQPVANAGRLGGGDDAVETPDDEDGLDYAAMPLFIVTQTTVLNIPVMNMTGSNAKLVAWCDFNKDGDFLDAGEMVSTTVANNATTATINFPVPAPPAAAVGEWVGLRLRLASATEPMVSVGPLNSGEVEDYEVQIIGYDYGDQPNTYGTTDPNGPRHIITNDLKLGASVDAEVNGVPDAMAGLMGAGDDGDPGLVTFGTSTPAGDDENGIMLTAPMVPGTTSTFMCDAMNMTTSPAVLQAWVDFNGDGDFLDANEHLTTGSFAPAGAVVPVGGLSGAKLTFDVPAGAVFNAGNAHVRFRLSPLGGLAPNTQTDPVPFGEIEDYKFPLAVVGNMVFQDYDFDGVQDAGEPGIDNVGVMLTWAGADNTIGTADDVMYNTTTGPASGQQTGEYYVSGLINGTYKVKFTTPANMTPTRTNQGGNDVLDSDGAITGMDLTMAMETFTIVNVTALPTAENGNGDNGTAPTGTFPDNQSDETHDQGFAFLDYGDLPENGGGDQFNTSMVEGGAVHVVIPGFKLGASVDGERDGVGNATATGDDTNNTGSADDEDGVSFTSPLIPGYNATISVVSMNPTGAAAVLQGWIDWNNNGLLDAAEALAFTSSAVPTGNATTTFTFPVPATAIFNDGMVFARFRLSPTGGLSADGPDKYGVAAVPQGEVEDYMKKVMCAGNIVWEDYDFDGTQDVTEPGIGGVTVNMVWGGPDGNVTTTADNVTYTTTTLSAVAGGNIIGEYSFCGLIEGQYKFVAITPSDMTPTNGNVASAGDVKDSDGIVTSDITMTMTDPFTVTLPQIVTQPTGEDGNGDNAPGNLGTFPDNQVNETFDFGFVSIDFGDLPDTYVTDDTPDNSGAQHVMQPGKYLGTCVDAEQNANIDPSGQAGLLGSGDDADASTRTQGTCTTPNDDENGVTFPTPLVPGYEACVDVTYTAIDVPGLMRTGNTFLSLWIDYNGDGDVTDAGEQAVTDLALLTGTDVSRRVCFTVPSGATFNGGAARVRARIHCQPGLGSAGLAVGGEVEDYYVPVAKIGNYVWFDNDLEGDQNTTDTPNPGTTLAEAGINGVTLALVWYGEDGLFNTSDDRIYLKTTASGTQGELEDEGGTADGIYYFCGVQSQQLDGKNYRIVPIKYATDSNTGFATFSDENGVTYDVSNAQRVTVNGTATDRELLTAPRKILTIPNNAPVSDNMDSDNSDNAPYVNFMVPSLVPAGTLPTGENGVGDIPTVFNYPDNRTNLTLDMGFVQEPNIEITQQIMGVEKGDACGQFKIIMDACVWNSGGYENGYQMSVPLRDIQVEAELASQLGAAFLSVMGDPVLIVEGDNNPLTNAASVNADCGIKPQPAHEMPTVNAGFDGSADVNLLSGTNGILWPGEKLRIRYMFQVKPSNLPEPQSLNLLLQAEATGKAVNYQNQIIQDFFTPGAPQYVASDLSNDGVETFDGTYNDPDVPTNIGDCWKTSQSMAANDMVQISLPETCEVLIKEDMILEGEDENCIDDAYCLGGYYRVNLRTMLGNFAVPNPVPASYIGQVIIAEVENIASCNKVWGKFILEDKLPPVITNCPAGITVSCAYTADQLQNPTFTQGLGLALPTVSDCSAYTPDMAHGWQDIACNGTPAGVSALLTRTWTYTDVYGNISLPCVQTITLQRATLAEVNFPVDVTVQCSAAASATEPSATGVPTVPAIAPAGGRLNIYPHSNYCEMQATYADQIIDVCPGTYKILRTWTVYDWCTATTPGVNPLTYLQLIKVVDEHGPDVVTTYPSYPVPSNMTVSTGSNDCTGTVNLPAFIVADNCSAVQTAQATISGVGIAEHGVSAVISSNFVGSNAWSSERLVDFGNTNALPLGTYSVTYTFTDACGNTRSYGPYAIVVEDQTPPVAVCDEWTQVALGANGQVVVYAGTFDDGSYDNCAPVQLRVRRMDAGCNISNANFTPSVTFCCDDVNDTLQVILRVYDVLAPLANSVAQDAHEGHYNDCMVNVLVEDKLKPICTPPANVTVSCDNFDPSLWPYGTATASDNCSVVSKDSVVTGTLNTCNIGTLTRRWTVRDAANLTSTCQQTITVTPNQYYFVRFPEDKVITNCVPGGNYGAPEFYGEDCELLATSFVDEVFTVVPDACYKIERTWTVINWCSYNSNTPCTIVPNPDGETHGKVVVSAPNNGINGWAASSMTVTAGSYTGTFNYGVANGGGNHAGFGGWSQNANCYKYKQIIKIIDNAAPTVVSTTVADTCDYTTNDAALWHHMSWWDNAIASHDLCEGAVNLSLTATDACAGENVKVHYQLYLDLDHDGVMETVVPGSAQAPTLYGAVRYNNYQNQNFGGGEIRPFVSAPLVANNFGFGLETQPSGDNLVASVRFVNTANVVQNTAVQLPYGTHKIKWIIEDGCGNEKVHETTFTVDDCKKPTVVCTNGVSVNLMNGPMNTVSLWAIDLYEYANDNCTPEDLIKITVVRADADNGSLPTGTSVDFSCADLLPGLSFGTVVVNVYAEDAAGNFDFCAMAVQVQDNMNVCGNGTNASVAGALQTEVVDGVQDAAVELDGSANGIPMLETTFSTLNGEYLFNNTIPIASNATITPTLDVDPLNGVNTWDLVLISRHILGLEPLGSPYKLIAADANKSGTVTTFDIVELRKLILGTYQVLPNNTSWRFINAHQEFTSDENPFADVIQENIQIANIQGSILDGNFVGAKIGDVDGSAIPNQLVSADDRTTGMLLFDVEDRTVKAGEVFTLTLKAAQAVKGYQFTLNLNGLEAMEAVPGEGMTADNFGLFPGAVTTSADGTPGVFGVTFRATKSGRVSEMLSVSSRITRAMAFDGANRLDVALRFHNGAATTIASQGFELYQNAPNPWISRTVIGFYLPEAAEARLTIFDGTGRVLHTAKGDFGKGYNAFPLDRKMVDQVSQLYYKVETATDSDVKQMIQTR